MSSIGETDTGNTFLKQFSKQEAAAGPGRGRYLVREISRTEVRFNPASRTREINVSNNPRYGTPP